MMTSEITELTSNVENITSKIEKILSKKSEVTHFVSGNVSTPLKDSDLTSIAENIRSKFNRHMIKFKELHCCSLDWIKVITTQLIYLAGTITRCSDYR